MFGRYGAGKAIYSINRTIAEIGKHFNDRQHILYVNASYKGTDDIGKLMHDFLCSDPDEMYTELMAERAKYLKSDPKGVQMMCKAMEDMRDEIEVRTMVVAIKNIMESFKITAQQAMDALKIPAAEQPKYLERI